MKIFKDQPKTPKLSNRGNKNMQIVFPNKDEEITRLKNELSSTKQKLEALQLENTLLSQRLSIIEKIFDQKIKDKMTLKKYILSDIIENITELDLFGKRLGRHNKRTTYNLLYKATRDGDKASEFHNLCDQKKNTLVLIKTDKGRRFGGFTTQTWEGDNINKKDDAAFVFSLDKLKVYPVESGEDAIGCYALNGPDFCGWNIVIQDNFFSKSKCYTCDKELSYQTTEDYELNGGEKYFGVAELEVFEVKLE